MLAFGALSPGHSQVLHIFPSPFFCPSDCLDVRRVFDGSVKHALVGARALSPCTVQPGCSVGTRWRCKACIGGETWSVPVQVGMLGAALWDGEAVGKYNRKGLMVRELAGSRAMAMQRGQRLGWLLGVGLIAVGGALVYRHYFLARPVASGPAGPPVAMAPFAEPWTERAVICLGIGDSITAGLGAASKQHGCFARLIENPDDEYADMQGRSLSGVLPNLRQRNIAVSGSTSIQHHDYIAERLKPFDESVFGLVVMTTGGNDIIHNYGRTPPREGAMYGATLEQARPWIANYELRLHAMVDAIELLFPGGCEIYLANIYDPTDSVGDAPSIFLPTWSEGLAVHAAYNRVLAKVAAERDSVYPVPLYESFLGHGSHCKQFWREHYDASDPTYWFYSNVEDPNDRGHDVVRRVFLNAILEHSILKHSVM